MIKMYDVAENVATVTFSDASDDEPQRWVPVLTADPDDAAPELDLNNLTISGAPTQPDAPNGETVVTIVYHARDDKSGVGTVSYRLLDPQGGSHFEYHYHDNFHTTFFEGDPTAWAAYEVCGGGACSLDVFGTCGSLPDLAPEQRAVTVGRGAAHHTGTRSTSCCPSDRRPARGGWSRSS
jgi:hypothetical protein